MSAISLSENYIKVLKYYLSVLRGKDKKDALLFKYNDEILLSRMDNKTSIFINIMSPRKNVDFEEDELGIENLDTLIKYLENVKYPSPLASLEYKTATTSNGIEIPSFLIKGKGYKYFLPVANTEVCFSDPWDRKTPVLMDKDPNEQFATFKLNPEQIGFIRNNVKLLDAPDIFGLGIANDKVSIYINNTGNQQFHMEVDPLCVKVSKNYEDLDQVNCRLFSTEFFSMVDSFGCDFEFDVRRAMIKTEKRTKEVNYIKAYGKVTFKDGNYVNVIVGSMEMDDHACTGLFNVLK